MSEKVQKPRIPEVNTALHVIKGAIVKVLHTPLTTSTEAQKKNEGRIAVEYSGPSPSKEQLNQIEKLANDKIKENVDILWFPMNRAEAEEKYKKNPVNETYIYDKFPVPPELKELKIVEIPDWNVNCSMGPLLKKTGEVPALSIKRINYRESKKELEFVFELGNAGASVATSSESKSKTIQPSDSIAKPVDLENDKVLSELILKDMFAELKAHGVQITTEKEKDITESLQSKILNKIIIVKNTAYSRGFKSLRTISNVQTSII